MNRRVLPLIIGSLLLPLGCGGNDEPTGPSFSTLSVTTASLPNAVPSVAYSETLVATGGDGSYRWSLTVGLLPTGLSLNTLTGDITGTPTGASSTFTIQVESGDGQSATQDLTITVTLAVTTTSLPNAAETVAYSETLAATGGDGSYTWSLTVGSLPADLSLNTLTGEISGTPTVIETDDFTVEVISGDGQTATQALTITVGSRLDVQETAINQSIYPGFFDPDSVTVRKNIPVEITLTTEQREHVNLVSILPWVSSIAVNPPGTPTLTRFVPDQAGTFKIRNIGHGFEGRVRLLDPFGWEPGGPRHHQRRRKGVRALDLGPRGRSGTEPPPHPRGGAPAHAVEPRRQQNFLLRHSGRQGLPLDHECRRQRSDPAAARYGLRAPAELEPRRPGARVLEQKRGGL